MKQIRHIIILICITAILTPAAFAEKRALVIGNGAYKDFPALPTPVNDARAMASTLGDLGFSVIKKTDVTHQEMEQAVRDFGMRLRKGDIALFYFSGHGSELDGFNYLVPVKSGIISGYEVKFKAVPAEMVLGEMENSGTQVNIIILDACRNKPPKGGKKSLGQGLARMDAPVGTFIAYATAPGTVAWTGRDDKSIFTKHLVKAMKTPGLKIEDVIKKVRKSVVAETSGKKRPQVPWQSSCLMGDFYFAGSSGAVIVTPKKETSLTVRPDVSDAEVWINGKKMGTGSLRFAPLSPGDYRIKVTKDGYLPYQTSVKIGKGESLDVPAYLAKPEPPEPKPVRKQRTTDKLWTDPVTGMEFVRIPKGCFKMGSPSGEKDRDSDEVLHEVCVDGFWMGKYEVTNRQYRKYKSGHDSKDYEGNSLDGDKQPAVYVSWDDAKAFAKWLTGKSRHEFRLPTEAEWEYACRAGSRKARFWGDDPDDACRYANVADQTAKRKWSGWTIHNCDDGYAVTAPAGSFRSNSFGLYDMLGNVWEWCEDIYADDAYSKHRRNNPIYAVGGSGRVYRGGSWSSLPAGVRCAGRPGNSPAVRYSDLGFRLVRTP
ncbi:SUMF1/EgtB/PvdO family nonheme iron enzyme [Desulfococcaceae bacterium HSG8]|nr:SUMF1/EgtB/PvdO family nonheme iron enzyme [Desulfococcaceae bacterium HSG8]